MKVAIKIVLLIILVTVITVSILDQLENNITKKMDASDSFLDIDRVNDDDVYLLYFHTDKINILSVMQKPVTIIWFGVKTNHGIIKNRGIVSQNYNVFTENFTKKKYMKVDIDKHDYSEEKVCEIKLEVIPSMENSHSTIFVGNSNRINEFIDMILTIKTIIITLVVTVAILASIISIKKKDIYFVMLGIFLLLSLFKFDFFIKAVLVSVFFVNLHIFSRRIKPIIFAICILLSFINIQSLEIIKVIIILLIATRVYNTVTRYEAIGIIPTVALSMFLGVRTFNYYSLNIFYNEAHLLVFVLMIIAYFGYYLAEISNEYNGAVNFELLRGISHDFKIPLSVIKLNQELMEAYLITEAERKSAIASISSAVSELEKMISSLTAFLYKRKYVGSKYSTSVKNCFERIEKSFEKYKAIHFSVICDEADVILPIDSIWFNRLIYNLVDNAFKYSKEDGEPFVKLEYKKLKKKVLITVTDNGIGIEKEELNKIFTPFYRIDGAHSKSGLGLGLTIIKEIVNQLDGEIKISSKIGEGTIVNIEINAR